MMFQVLIIITYILDEIRDIGIVWLQYLLNLPLIPHEPDLNVIILNEN